MWCANSEVLRQQLVDSVAAQQSKLKSLQQESAEIDRNLRALGEPDTSAGFDFYNQLTAAQLLVLVQVESSDATFRLDRVSGKKLLKLAAGGTVRKGYLTLHLRR